jgi:uncharacterized protein (TIGR02145 family)
MKKDIFTLIVFVITIFFIKISIYAQETGLFTDSRDSVIYKTVKIDDQWWMAENLKYQPAKTLEGASGSNRILIHDSETNQTYVLTYVSYNENDNNVPTYGYLYNWEAACNVCPKGWHLPDDAEWGKLVKYLGGINNAGTAMKEIGNTHWISSHKKIKATNSSGFSALPAGERLPNGRFEYLGIATRFWSRYALNNSEAYAWSLSGRNKSVGHYHYHKLHFFSVRCIKN